MSPDSVKQAARLGARMVIFSQKAWEEQKTIFDEYRDDFRSAHGEPAPPPIVCDFTYCHGEAEVAEERAREYVTGYLASILHHYELASEHYKHAKGYEEYGNNVEVIRAIGLERMAQHYLKVQAWGTPQQILDKLAARREIIGDYDLTVCVRYAGVPYQQAEDSLRLFAAEVLPELHAWQRLESVA